LLRGVALAAAALSVGLAVAASLPPWATAFFAVTASLLVVFAAHTPVATTTVFDENFEDYEPASSPAESPPNGADALAASYKALLSKELASWTGVTESLLVPALVRSTVDYGELRRNLDFLASLRARRADLGPLTISKAPSGVLIVSGHGSSEAILESMCRTESMHRAEIAAATATLIGEILDRRLRVARTADSDVSIEDSVRSHK
jgi:hypothetical protein